MTPAFALCMFCELAQMFGVGEFVFGPFPLSGYTWRVDLELDESKRSDGFNPAVAPPRSDNSHSSTYRGVGDELNTLIASQLTTEDYFLEAGRIGLLPACEMPHFGLNHGGCPREPRYKSRQKPATLQFLAEEYSRCYAERAILQYAPQEHAKTMPLGSDEFLQTYFDFLEEHVQLDFLLRKIIQTRKNRYDSDSKGIILWSIRGSHPLGLSHRRYGPSRGEPDPTELPEIIPDCLWQWQETKRSSITFGGVNDPIACPLYFHWELEDFPFRDKQEVSFEN